MFRDCTENYYLNIKYRAPDAHANQSIIIKWQNKSTTRHQIERHTISPITDTIYTTTASLIVKADAGTGVTKHTILKINKRPAQVRKPCAGLPALVRAGMAMIVAEKSLILQKIFLGLIGVMTTQQQYSKKEVIR
jgi:hypothetical protein